MRVLAFLLLILPGFASAQFLYEFDSAIPVVAKGGVTLKYPWSGGLNTVQVNTLDVNHDTKQDLIIFERMGNLVLTFIQESDQYVYTPEFEAFFPTGINNWVLLRDFNSDGRKDLFTGDTFGMKVYVNKTQPGQALAWEPFLFFNGTEKEPWVLTKKTTLVPLQMSYDDLPSIADADGDGDLDIFAMDFPGKSKIEFHKNFSMERYGTLDSLDFERVSNTTQGWAGVRECTCGEFAFNSAPCPTSGKEDHAGGKSLFAFDADNDGDLDMLFSEAECDQLFLFENASGSTNPNDALVNSAVPYPGTFSLMNYPSPYREDVDFDGIKDLILSPNLFAREFPESNFKESVWFYKNTGTNAVPLYAAVNKHFLQGDMLDVGDNAVPAFFDVDNDGDQDMFIGCYINPNYEAASLYLFENTGSSTEPQFEFVTDNYRGLSNMNFRSLKPRFIDMNKDGKIDFVFTAQSDQTQLYYILNTGNSTADFSGSIVATGFIALWREENITPVDINLDGLPDLIVGRLNGAMDYFKNTGTASVPAFTLGQENYLSLRPTVLRQTPAVAIGDLNNDSKDDLIFGDQSGSLTLISNFRQAEDASGSLTEIVYNSTLDDHIAQNLGGRIWPTIASLYGFPQPEIITGNILGGLHILKNRFRTDPPEEPGEPIIKVYPNPAPSTEILTIEVDTPAELQLFTVLGQAVNRPIQIQSSQPVSLDIAHLNGVYLLRFSIRGKTYSRKIVIR